jgi:hypothetical protein
MSKPGTKTLNGLLPLGKPGAPASGWSNGPNSTRKNSGRTTPMTTHAGLRSISATERSKINHVSRSIFMG